MGRIYFFIAYQQSLLLQGLNKVATIQDLVKVCPFTCKPNLTEMSEEKLFHRILHINKVRKISF